MCFLSEHQQLVPAERELLLGQLRELLQRRREEVTLLRREQKAIGTFLSMCRKVLASVQGRVLGQQVKLATAESIVFFENG